MEQLRTYGLQVKADYRDIDMSALPHAQLSLVIKGNRTIYLEGVIQMHLVVQADAILILETRGTVMATLTINVASHVALTIEQRGVVEGVVCIERTVHLQESASVTDISAVQVRGKFDLFVRAVHEGTYSSSRLLSKVVVQDGGKAIARGSIVITRTAEGSRGFERIDALLLGPLARADVLPMLLVDTDDVACTHAASVGAIDEEHLFYLMSRGLNEETAKGLMAEGFLNEVCLYGRTS